MCYFVFIVLVLRQQTANNENEKKVRMKFIYEKNEINLERWKQSDIIHTIRNNVCQPADMTFNQINYAIDFTFVLLLGELVFFSRRHVYFFSVSPSNRQIRVETNNFSFISGHQVT